MSTNTVTTFRRPAGHSRRGVLARVGAAAAGGGALIAAACAGQSAGRTSGAPAPSGQPVKLRYMGRGTIANQDLQKAGLVEFQKLQPKITVEFEAPAQFLPALRRSRAATRSTWRTPLSATSAGWPSKAA